MDQKKIYQIDGHRFSTLDEFYEEIGRVLIPGADWGHNLDAFNDILRAVLAHQKKGSFYSVRIQIYQESDWAIAKQ
jgi:hypothetical protein